MKLLKHIAGIVLILLPVLPLMAQDTPEEIKERADKLFEKEQYVSATPLYLHVLSLDPRNAELNFKYGACLLFNSNQKKEAIRYLNYGVTDPNIDSRAWYFRGKALHLDFQFEEAKNNYKEYLNRRDKKDDRYNVEREIEMCNNGKKLLTTFTDIIVAEKQEIDQSKFYKIYTDSKTIGGDILVSAQFQSKLDKKKGHVPVIHYAPNAQAIYYSSYGEDGATGKDIYVRRRLPNGQWGESQRLPGGVNTNFDEDFPYLHPSGNFLYFSSKGHNSMGGYDIFMSTFDHESGMFRTPENVDFAISSPDDDLFYVVDSLFRNAYFASARQSQDGKLYVYKVKVARVPIQEVIIMGDFLSEINPEDQKMTVSLAFHSNGKEVGTIKADAGKGGKYSFVFPQGGKYDYLVDVEGSDKQYKFTVELPFIDELRPLKQKIVHTTENGNEIVRIVNMFDENVEGAEAVIAQVIRKKSELDVNLDKFDLEKIEADINRDAVLADMGYKGMSMNEVANQLKELAEDTEQNAIIAERIQSNINSEILAKSDRVAELDRIQQELTEKANKASDPLVQHKLLNEAKIKQVEKETLIAQIKGLEQLNEDVMAQLSGSADVDPEKIIDIQEKFESFLNDGDENAALDVLVQNKELINNVKSVSPEGVSASYTDRVVQLREEIRKDKDRRDEYRNTVSQLEDNIRTLEREKETAKKKDRERIEADINSKKEELRLMHDEIEKLTQRINRKEDELNVAEEQLASLHNAIETDAMADVDQQAVEEAVEEINIIDDKGHIDYDEQLAQLEEEHPEIKGGTPIENHLVRIESENQQAEERILNDPSLSELEQMYRLVENNENTISKVDKRIGAIDEQLSNGSDPFLEKERNDLLAFKEELEAQNSGYNDRAEELKQETPDAALSLEDVIKEVAPTYNERLKEAKANNSLSDKEQLEAIADIHREFVKDVNAEIEIVNEQLENNPEDETAQQRKETLQKILDNTNRDLTETESAIEQLSTDVVAEVPTNEEIVNDVSPNYSERVQEINEQNGAPLDKEKALQQEDEALLADLAKEKKSVEKKIKRNPEDAELKNRLTAIEATEDMVQDNIAERTQTIKALEGGTSTTDVTAVKTEVINELAPDYSSQIDEIENSEDLEFNKKKRIASVAAGFLEQLKEEQARIDKDLNKSPDDETLKTRKEAVEQLISQQQSIIEELLSTGVSELTQEESESIIEEVDPAYFNTVSNATNSEDILEAENSLQEKLREVIETKEKENKRSYSVTVDMELSAFKKLLEESEKREADLAGNVATVEDDQKVYIEEIRESLIPGNADELTNEHVSKADLERQEEVLEQYERELDRKIEEVKKEIENDQQEQLVEELKWLEEEKEAVQKKRREVQITIGEIEREIIGFEGDDQELNQLAQEEAEIKKQLAEGNLSKQEEKALNRELENVQEQKTTRENELLEAELASKEAEANALTEELRTVASNNPESEVAEKAQSHYETSSQEVEELIEEAKGSRSEEERNYLLNEAKDKQEALNNEMQEVIREERVNAIEEEHGIELSSKEELKKKKRQFIIEIGELTREIAEVEEDISTAKRKDKPALEKRKDQLENEKELLESRLEAIDKKLGQEETVVSVVNEGAMEQELTFNEERSVAASDEYKEYQPLAEEALKVENEIRNLEAELAEEREVIQRMIDEGEDEEAIQLKARRIKSIESDIDRKNLELVQKRYTAEQALPENEEEAMKMQNLVARGVQPIKVAAVATALLNMPNTGFSINTEAERPNNGVSSAIPVGVENPTGLVYRVQVGAFARPLRPDVFKEFNPVSGEKIEGTNITRYMAGYFNSSETVVNARAQIRDLGYNDAFIVAYCDGKRITFGEARRKEAEGTCVPKGSNEIMIEVAENTADKLGIPLTTELKEVPEWTYNQAPGAVEADPIENMKGLFFTVQVGVFNRPISEEDVYNLTEIFTIRLPNGQIRYSTGMFDSAEEAVPRLNQARNSGVNGAFIVAYFNGERISIGNARRLLAQNGPSILQSRMDQEPVEERTDIARTDTVTTDVVELPPPVENWEKRVQIVTKQQFDEFPRDVLNRYNAEGSFYFDEQDRRVKSVIYDNEDHLPRLWNFRDDIDTVYLPPGQLDDEATEIISVVFTDSLVPGAFMDWMLRVGYRRDMFRTYKGVEVRIFGVGEDDLETMMQKLRLFGVEPEVILESEEELELKDN